MARKPTAADFKEHENTYKGFMAVTKWSIISLILTMVALYAFIIADLPWLGGVLLLAIPALIGYRLIAGSSS